LLITSSQPAEGKSTTSLAVARGIAKLGRRVVLLDVDLRRPALHASIGIPNEHGMSTLLTSNDEVDDAIVESPYENLWVVPSGPIRRARPNCSARNA
jgi:Mrp family chromosome partitioning ATPase